MKTETAYHRYKALTYMPKKKPSRKNLIKKLDKLFSLKVRVNGVCELRNLDNVKCGGGLQCAHIITRSRKALRWDFNNALCLCAGHHVYFTHNPDQWAHEVEKFFPDKWWYVQDHKEDMWDKDLDKVLIQLTDWEAIEKKIKKELT